MLYWILNAIISAIWDNVYKKSVMLSKWKISDKYYQFIGNLFMLISLPIAYLYFSFEGVSISIIVLLIFTSILNIIWELFEQYAYKNEKMSILIPYWEFQSVFTIIIWFIVFSDSSFITFLFAILAWITLVIWWLNFKNLKFNKYCLALTISSLLYSIKFILYWFILIQLTEFSVMFYTTLINSIILFIIIFLSNELMHYKRMNKKMSSFILLENIIRITVTFITLFLIKELWLVQAVMIGMIYLAISMIFAFIFFKNIPTKKELIVTILVTTFIWLWTIFW